MNPDVTNVGLNVVSMTVEKPLIVKDNGPQLFRMEGTFNKAKNCIDFDFYSVNADGKKTITHARCGVKYENAEEWGPGWTRNKYMIQSRIASLIKGVQDGGNDLIKRGMAYKLFGGLIHYGHKYRGMEEVVLDNNQLEATALVSFQTEGTDAKFLCSPYRTDSVAHLSGFVMLGNEAADTTKEVYVSQGWDNYRVSKPLTMDKKYRSYVKMQHESAKMVVGDVYVFDGDEIVAVVEGLRFHALPRQLMDSLLSAAGGKAPLPKPAANAKPKAAAPQKEKAKAVSGEAKSSSKIALPSKPASSGVTVRALDIIAGEVGVSASDLNDDSSFSDMGVDSLLSLNITGKFREELDIDMASTSFVDYPTVKDLKHFLSQHDGPADVPEESSNAEAASSDASSDPTTPPPLSSDSDGVSSPPSSVTGDEPSQPLVARGGDTVTLIRSTVAEELGVGIEDLDGSADLASLGMDSLMSLSVLGKLRESSGIDLPSDFFAENSTFAHVEKAVGGKEVRSDSPPTVAQSHAEMIEDVNPKSSEQTETPVEATKEASAPVSETPKNEVVNNEASEDRLPTEDSPSSNTDNTSQQSSSTDAKHDEAPEVPWAATSILLQGSPKTATKILFLLPDGSGSATSYSLLPTISPSLAVYALNSPFIKCPPAFDTDVSGLTALYVAEILRRQPQGPYIVGGWSAGGVCAFEAVQQLQAAGKEVERLILLDAPCPTDLDILPGNLHSWFDSIGLLGPEGNQGGTPEWLIPHFDASIRALADYQPPEFGSSAQKQMPRIYALWAKDGVCKYPTDPRPPQEKSVHLKFKKQPRSVTWLLENREGDQLKRNGWEKFLGEDCVMETSVVKGANHFTLMKEEHAQRVSDFVRDAVE